MSLMMPHGLSSMRIKRLSSRHRPPLQPPWTPQLDHPVVCQKDSNPGTDVDERTRQHARARTQLTPERASERERQRERERERARAR